MSLYNLKRKYSWGPIPEWELAKIAPAKPEKTGETGKQVDAAAPKRGRGRPPKQTVTDGDG